MPADDRTITILVLGDELVGKSSLISTFVSRYFAPDGVPGLMTRVQLPRSEGPSSCPTTIVDSQQGDAALTSASPPPRVDSIVLVYDLSRAETFTRLEKHWLPLLERAYEGKVGLDKVLFDFVRFYRCRYLDRVLFLTVHGVLGLLVHI
mmetsp:Transcript_16003/g.37744  ORF Transcript_16003/g.37744 Transcript_16003/m.37744 type:complete len:149 (+) Transcript_16003:351-797(+)